jgi:hypothetical protein
VTATREKLLDMAACFEAMGHPVAACDAREAASKLAPPAPDDAPRAFKVGDRVRGRETPWIRRRDIGEIDSVDTGETTMPYRVVFSSGERAWYHADDLALADAPDDEGLSEEGTALDESSARYLENVADEGYLDDTDPCLLRKIAAEIRTALANGAGEVSNAAKWRDRCEHARDEVGAIRGEVARLRVELADARQFLADTERVLEKKRGAFNFECSLRSTAERARLDAEKERDALRAEIANEAARLRAERDQYLRALEAIAPNDKPFQLTLPDQGDLPMYGRIALVSPPWIATAANDDGTFDVNHETYDEDTCHGETEQIGFFVTEEWLADREEERDSLRAELDEARRELETERIKNDGWHDWAWEKCPRGCDTDEKRRAAIDAKLAAAKAGPVVTADEVTQLRNALGMYAPHPAWVAARPVLDRLATFIQARGETEAGK